MTKREPNNIQNVGGKCPPPDSVYKYTVLWSKPGGRRLLWHWLVLRLSWRPAWQSRSLYRAYAIRLAVPSRPLDERFWRGLFCVLGQTVTSRWENWQQRAAATAESALYAASWPSPVRTCLTELWQKQASWLRNKCHIPGRSYKKRPQFSALEKTHIVSLVRIALAAG